ncbi:AAA family ATPase [Actinomadura sp. GTD37]|uniref:helix-turn-helix transcriptional regulator n=1 Tax=Actinomadura sp. GTD37 TaxID=1778030 RepID=UPI0035C0509B
MGDVSRSEQSTERMIDRFSERGVLDGLVDTVRAGHSQVLVLRGEAGMGKTVLLEYLTGRASECRVARVAGVQSEIELAFAGLHQLCAPMLDHLEALPEPQRDALRTTFGISSGPPPDRFLLGLAVLGLLSEAAGQKPLICLVDDYQWLDGESAQTLGFVARRLAADPVGLVFATRVPAEGLSGLPELVVDGLREADARELLESVLVGTLDARVKELLVAETRGNPLALLELPRGLTPEQLAGGFGLLDAAPLSGRIEESFRRRLDALPAESRRLLRLAAAEPSGDPLPVWRAAAALGISVRAAEPAVQADLLRLGARVRFRHPLARSAAYWSAAPDERRRFHAALAEVTDPAADPDRLAWHRAAAAPDPDEDVAAELERSAERAQARGGLAAAAAFLERAVLLTPDPARRAVRALAAGEAKHQAGAPDAAAELLTMAETGPLDELGRARLSRARGQMAFSVRSGDAPLLLLDAARRFEELDARPARETYLEALTAALSVADRRSAVGGLDVARAALAARARADGARAPDLLLDAMATLIADGYPAGAPAMRRALGVFREEDLPVGDQLRWLFAATRCSIDVWDGEGWLELSGRQVELARSAGALSLLPFALTQRLGALLRAGQFAAATAVADEILVIREATANNAPDLGTMTLAGWQGRSEEALGLIDRHVRDMKARGQGYAVSLAHCTAAMMCNGLGRHEDALASAELAIDHPEELAFASLALVELIEAAVLCGRPERAAAAAERLTELTRPSGTGWGLGVEARSRALLGEGAEAERLYREAIDRLSATCFRSELARAHLLYGEWLRRERRRSDARGQLRTACAMFEGARMDPFLDRAGRELRATGETARRRTMIVGAGKLTAQEVQIARLARDGLSNPEIATRMFISARTVQYHLSKVFAKLGINSRGELGHTLPNDHDPVPAG